MRRLFLLLLLSTLIMPLGSIDTAAQDEAVPSELEIEIHRQINDVRTEKKLHDLDLAALKLQSDLIAVARAHSKDMLERDYFAHTNPDGEDVGDRVSDADIEWSSVGENLFYIEATAEEDVAEEAVDGWVDSPGHFKNIITDFSFTGIGVAESGQNWYVTQVFVNADPGHLEEKGIIYDNSELDDLQEDEDGFQLTARTGGLIVLVIVILIGLDAKRRNDKYYGRRW